MRSFEAKTIWGLAMEERVFGSIFKGGSKAHDTQTKHIMTQEQGEWKLPVDFMNIIWILAQKGGGKRF